jgi:hypothetical protein
VGVVVPARDEESLVEPCLRALLTALDAAPAGVLCAVCVVLDRCRDATGTAARRALHGTTRATVDVLTGSARGPVAEVRDQGMRRVLDRLSAVPVSRTWLLSTDADSTVGPDWVVDHLRYADSGADAVAGTVGLDAPGRLDAAVLRRYASVVEAGFPVTGSSAALGDPGGHRHAYAANLGVRAGAYLDVGGFPPVTSGEDHALLHRLHRAGYRIARPTDLRVRTSARLDGRAPGGLADLLRRLHADRSATGHDGHRTAAPSGPRTPNH